MGRNDTEVRNHIKHTWDVCVRVCTHACVYTCVCVCRTTCGLPECSPILAVSKEQVGDESGRDHACKEVSRPS